MKTPIWLLDVDGVINACTAYPDKDMYPEWKSVSAKANGKVWPITFAPEVVEFIAHVHNSGQVEVRWLTTWEDSANEDLGPKLGLPQFEVAGRRRPCACGNATCRAWFKSCAARAVREAEPDRPVIWTDDDLRWEVQDLIWADREGFCVVAPYTEHGLMPHNLSTIKTYIENANGKAAA